MVKGSCLCGAIRFTLQQVPEKFYRCHCSLCRKQTGVGHNLATLIPATEFAWEDGQQRIATWQKTTGYRNDFCASCGSTVPNALRDVPYIWVPIGLIEEDLALECLGDYCTEDAMSWDCHRSRHSTPGPVRSLDELLPDTSID
ncbi:GFA family protein [Tatumella ptyseos]|uniref:Glutathione-dependent formaldehyde-activating enzyme n=2 Tax=Tatumella ptyseos TaxID=82987 RepID=A0A085JBM2_9GAMM|nr:glutathione-dependent formaldehyde-activating enzyme [Tatumella ptyseos ATCC 33301]SQK73931.1 Uncharacterized conserved protein [Tatumella ptyseos]